MAISAARQYDAHDACLTDEIIVSVSPQRCPYQAPLNTVQLGPGIAQAGYLNHRRVAQVQSRACQ